MHEAKEKGVLMAHHQFASPCQNKGVFMPKTGESSCQNRGVFIALEMCKTENDSCKNEPFGAFRMTMRTFRMTMRNPA